MAKKVIDIYIVYEIIKRLSTPFTDTEAFNLGLIDDKGILQKRRRDMTPQERQELTLFDLMIINIKKYLAKLPGGDSKLRNFATALFLIKEDINHGAVEIDDIVSLVEEITTEKTFAELNEETTVSIGGGAMDNTVQPKTSKFGKCQVYHVSGDTFNNCKRVKGRYEKFMKTVGTGPLHDSIQDYARNNPAKSIMLHDERMGTYTMLKLGSKETW